MSCSTKHLALFSVFLLFHNSLCLQLDELHNFGRSPSKSSFERRRRWLDSGFAKHLNFGDSTPWSADDNTLDAGEEWTPRFQEFANKNSRWSDAAYMAPTSMYSAAMANKIQKVLKEMEREVIAEPPVASPRQRYRKDSADEEQTQNEWYGDYYPSNFGRIDGENTKRFAPFSSDVIGQSSQPYHHYSSLPLSLKRLYWSDSLPDVDKKDVKRMFVPPVLLKKKRQEYYEDGYPIQDYNLRDLVAQAGYFLLPDDLEMADINSESVENIPGFGEIMSSNTDYSSIKRKKKSVPSEPNGFLDEVENDDDMEESGSDHRMLNIEDDDDEDSVGNEIQHFVSYNPYPKDSEPKNEEEVPDGFSELFVMPSGSSSNEEANDDEDDDDVFDDTDDDEEDRNLDQYKFLSRRKRTKPDAAEKSEKVKRELDNIFKDDVKHEEKKLKREIKESAPTTKAPSVLDFDNWLEVEYFKNLAASSATMKRKRMAWTPMVNSDIPKVLQDSGEKEKKSENKSSSSATESKQKITESLDHKLEEIEDVMIKEAARISKENAGSSSSQVKNMVANRLSAVKDLEEVRYLLKHLERTMVEIEDEKRNKQEDKRGENLLSALHVMAPSAERRKKQKPPKHNKDTCAPLSLMTSDCSSLNDILPAGTLTDRLLQSCNWHEVCYTCGEAFGLTSDDCDGGFLAKSRTICKGDQPCESASLLLPLRRRRVFLKRSVPPVCYRERCIAEFIQNL